MIAYSNPRMSAVIENWPHGKQRVTARFEIEYKPGKGERAVRVTTGAAKKLTYARRARIVDGDDGRTYIAELSIYGTVNVMQGDMKFSKETFHCGHERYAEMRALLEAEGL